MIGGTEFIIPIRDKAEALDLAIRLVLRLWPKAVIEDATAEEVLPAYESISFFGRHELLAFRDTESAEKWDKLGVDPSLNETLIHLIASDQELTVSLDDAPSAKMKAFAQTLRDALTQDLFLVEAA